MMQFKDIVQIQRNPIELPARSVFGSLLLESAKKINELKYFYAVQTLIRDNQTLRSPTCILLPDEFRQIEQQLSGGMRSVECVMGIAFALKGKNDSILADLALGYSEKIMNLFSKKFDGSAGVFKFPDITEHYTTSLEAAKIGEVQELKDGVLAYSSGINVVFSVWLV